LGKNYTKNFREKVEPPLNQQEGKTIYCHEFHSSED
jgi:cobyrinic acid a,c-diamide synthase